MSRHASARSHRPLGFLVTLVGLGALLGGSCRGAPHAESEEGVPAPAAPLRLRIVPDDLLQILVHEHPELSSPETGTRVDHEGNVRLPLIGAVHVAGHTPSEANAALEAAAGLVLRRPSVSLSVLEYAPRAFHLLGEVENSGSYDLDQPLTALAALARGGGFREGADRRKVALLRAEGDRLAVHFFNAETPGVDGFIPVQAGDLLFVRLRGSGTFREQVLPYLQGVAGPLNALAGLIVVTDRLNE